MYLSVLTLGPWLFRALGRRKNYHYWHFPLSAGAGTLIYYTLVLGAVKQLDLSELAGEAVGGRKRLLARTLYTPLRNHDAAFIPIHHPFAKEYVYNAAICYFIGRSQVQSHLIFNTRHWQEMVYLVPVRMGS